MSTLSNLQTDITNAHKTKSFLFIYGHQSYIPITGCVLSHILSCSELSSLEKMYYILADSLSCINSSKGRNRSISLPAKSWSQRLSCSKSEVFVLQKSLEDKGYFIIYRDKNDKGQNNRNTITSTVPDKVFNDLKYEPDRFDIYDIDNTKIYLSRASKLDAIDNTYISTLEGKRQHLEKTKMFIRVPYLFLKKLNSNCNISATSKVIMLYLFTKIYKSSANKCDPDNVLTHKSYSVVTSYQELHRELKLHRNSVSKALKDLEDNNLISKKRFFLKDSEDYNSRASKSLWQISLLNTSLITNDHDQKKQKDQEEQKSPKQVIISAQSKEECNDNKALESSKEWGCTKYDPACTDSGQLYSKDSLLNNSIIKNIDYIDANSENSSSYCSSSTSTSVSITKNTSINNKEEYFEDKPCLSSSESYNNSSFLNDSSRRNSKNISEQKEEWQELRQFYPLAEKDVSTLNFRSNREFSTNFVNQLLLKLYIKYPEKRFKNKFTFLSYMEKILANEKHQGPLVNHTTFRFSCNINEEDKNMQNYEKYLTEIENSFDISKEMQVRKKIAGRFGTKLAYEILTGVEFKTSLDNSFITALIPSSLDLRGLQTESLSGRQIETLSQQLEAVYGRNKYYVGVVGDCGRETEREERGVGYEKTPEYEEKDNYKDIKNWLNSDNYKNEKGAVFHKNLPTVTESKTITLGASCPKITEGMPLSKIPTTTSWYHIRKELIEELGINTDKAWFSKVISTECSKTATLTLTMPTRFMTDRIKNNYSHVIQRLAGRVGVKRVEYDYG